MKNLKNSIPLGFALPILIIILIELGIIQGLNFYIQKLNQDIVNLENKLRQKEENIKGGLEVNEFFKVFSQAVNIIEILKNRQSLLFIINRFNELMPKFLIIKDFDYDSEKNTIEISASVNNWQDYIRFHKYITNLKVFEVRDFTSPKLDEDSLINFSMVLLLKPDFFNK